MDLRVAGTRKISGKKSHRHKKNGAQHCTRDNRGAKTIGFKSHRHKKNESQAQEK